MIGLHCAVTLISVEHQSLMLGGSPATFYPQSLLLRILCPVGSQIVNKVLMLPAFG